MVKNLLVFCCLFFTSNFAFAETGGYSVDDLLARRPDNTPCATEAFSRGLEKHASIIDNVDEADSTAIEALVQMAFADPEIIRQALDCDELNKAKPDDTIVFQTVSYTFPVHTAKFPNGRKIEINYETQKSVLEQKLLLSTKKDLSAGDISPDIVSDAENGVVWVNVDPAWYGIMVAEHGTLDQFIKPGKTNVIAYRYIKDNVKSLYPKNHRVSGTQPSCTSKTAWAGDSDMINRAMLKTVGGGLPKEALKTDEEKKQQEQLETNDFYVMGDADLRFVAALEFAGDVALTIVSWGGYAVIDGLLKMARGGRIFRNIEKTLKTLKTSPKVLRFFKTSENVADIERVAKNAKNVEKLDESVHAVAQLERNAVQNVANLEHRLRALNSSGKAAKSEIKALETELEYATKYATASEKAARTGNEIEKVKNILANGKQLSPAKEKRLQELEQRIAAKTSEITSKTHKSGAAKKLQKERKSLVEQRNRLVNERNLTPEEAEQLNRELDGLKEAYTMHLNDMKNIRSTELAELEALDDVQEYKKLVQAKRDTAHAMYLIRNSKNALRANRGLLPVRAYRAAKSLRTGVKAFEKYGKVHKAEQVARASTSGFSAKVNDWLFHNTMRNINALAKVPAKLSFFVAAGKFALDMYDYTQISTGQYTNNIEMQPFLLLGADNLPGYENEINYGMWVFWSGSSISAADDDAAFLQAMGFADKFHQDLVELQDEENHGACDVDIFVVRPIIRNPGTAGEELYYLIMNDVPWTTHGFNEVSTETVVPTSTNASNGNGENCETCSQ